MRKTRGSRRRGRIVRTAVEGLEGRWFLTGTGTGAVQQGLDLVDGGLLTGAALTAPVGALTGKIVYTSGGHGYHWTGSSWTTGRGEVAGTEINEDLGNQDQMSLYAEYLLRAGATVVPMRPVGHQTREVVVDNASAGFSTPVGAWSNSTTGAPYYSTNNGNDTNRYAFAATNLNETAVARYTPNIPVAGFYPVYTWVLDSSNRSVDQLYRVNYDGGSAEVKVNHQRVGKGWVYLGTYYFAAGTAGNVEISNKSAVAAPNTNVIADAIRFGNGMGDQTEDYTYDTDDNLITTTHAVSGRSREDEASLYWVYMSRGWTAPGKRLPPSQVLASDPNIDNFLDSDDSANVGAPARWARYMNAAPFGQSVFLSFHTNASGGRGVLGLHNTDGGTGATTNQQAWASLVARETNNDLVALGSPPLELPWFNAGTNPILDRSDIDFGEINSSANGNEFDATILEVAYHDDLDDAKLLRDPKARRAVARASVQATIKYFNTYGGGISTLPPDSPTNLRATTAANGSVTLSWTAPATNATTGGSGAATGYKVYTSDNGYGFGDAIVLGNVTTTVITGLSTTAVKYFKVVATNAGGESWTDDVVAAKPMVGRAAPILIVNGYDRNDRTTNPVQAFGSGGNTVERVRLRYQNTRDYAVQFAEAIEAFNSNLGIATVQNEAVINNQVNLADYAAVLWISGEESTDDDTFNATEQSKVAAYIAAGGKFFASGSEIGWDLEAQAAGASFYNNTLKAAYVSDDAGTYTAAGATASIFTGVTSIVFDNGSGEGMTGTYNVDFPDVIAVPASSGATAAMMYSTGTIAAVQWDGGASKVVTMGFPFETITTAAKRNQVMAGVLNFFGMNLSLPTGTPDLVASSDTGASNSDNLTRLNGSTGNALTFAVGNTVPGAVVRVFAGGNLIGQATATATTTSVVTSGSFVLGDGAQSITATQTEVGLLGSAIAAGLTVTVDTAAPVLSLPGGQTFEATDSTGSVITFAPATATDANLVGVVHSPGNGGIFQLGDTTVTATATDLAGNTAAGTFLVTVVDPAFLVRGLGGAYRVTGQGNAQTLHVTGGILTLVGNAGDARPGIGLAVDAGTAILAADQYLSALTVAAGATLDLTTCGVVVDYADGGLSPIGTLANLVADAARGADRADAEITWGGTGITSSNARAIARHQVPGRRTTIGMTEASLFKARTGQLTFAGKGLDDSAVVLKYTYAADATMDGRVGDADVDVVYANYQDSRRPQDYVPYVTNRVFADGDFDFNGIVDDRDLDLLASTVDPLAPVL